MTYDDYKNIYGEDEAAAEYIIHSLDDSISSLATTTGRLALSKIKPEDTPVTVYSFTLADYKKTTYKNDINISAMKKAFKELDKAKATVKLPSGKLRVKWFDKLDIPMFGEEIKFRFNKATFPYLQSFRK